MKRTAAVLLATTAIASTAPPAHAEHGYPNHVHPLTRVRVQDTHRPGLVSVGDVIRARVARPIRINHPRSIGMVMLVVHDSQGGHIGIGCTWDRWRPDGDQEMRAQCRLSPDKRTLRMTVFYVGNHRERTRELRRNSGWVYNYDHD